VYKTNGHLFLDIYLQSCLFPLPPVAVLDMWTW